jgi:hypothetical protein
MGRDVYVVLLHSPIVNRHGEEVTTAVTNLDLHDIARSCKTYGVRRYFVVNPEPEQQRLVQGILGHWKEELAAVYHPSRAQALEQVTYCRTFEEAFNEASFLSDGKRPFVVMPDARPLPNAWTYERLRSEIVSLLGSPTELGDRPVMVVFGTGWGVSPKFYGHVDRFLEPIRGPGRYNHLSVRAAAAIVLDRLLSG